MKSIYIRTHRQSYVWMDEWVDLSEADLIALEEEIHSHLNATLSKGQQAKKQPVPPMPGSLPQEASSNEPVASSSKPSSSPQKATASSEVTENVNQREDLSPPPRRLRSRLRQIGSKLRAKL